MEQILLQKLQDFYSQRDEKGITNLEKIRDHQHIIRRIPTTDKSKSYEDAEQKQERNDMPGAVFQNGKLIGFGINILNENIYPLQSFEIYLRNCDLTGVIDLSDAEDLLFVDLYHNRIQSVKLSKLPDMRILGLQDNLIESLDVSGLPKCLGIDAGKNKLKDLNVSCNPELVELYINDNDISEVDLRGNSKLKYFYCHNNHIRSIDTRQNPHIRHLDSTGNPLKLIKALAPQREQKLPLELYAEEGGTVGLKFCPVYNAQWKETGEWKQTYYAYPDSGWKFICWKDKRGNTISDQAVWEDVYGSSREITAVFSRE